MISSNGSHLALVCSPETQHLRLVKHAPRNSHYESDSSFDEQRFGSSQSFCSRRTCKAISLLTIPQKMSSTTPFAPPSSSPAQKLNLHALSHVFLQMNDTTTDLSSLLDVDLAVENKAKMVTVPHEHSVLGRLVLQGACARPRPPLL